MNVRGLRQLVAGYFKVPRVLSRYFVFQAIFSIVTLDNLLLLALPYQVKKLLVLEMRIKRTNKSDTKHQSDTARYQ